MSSAEEVFIRHIKFLGLSDYKEYLKWCKSNGFRSTFNKTCKELDKEQKFITGKRALDHMKSSRKKNFESVISDIRSGNFSSTEKNSVYRKIKERYDCVRKDRLGATANMFLDALLYLEPKTKLFKTESYISALSETFMLTDFFIRPFDTWIPSSHNPEKQFSSFVRHLFCKYPVPGFMDKVWFRIDQHKYHDWFIHIGTGGSLRNLSLCPIKMTNKIGCHFLRAPDDFTIEEALRFGQISALGGDIRLMNALRPTKLMSLSKTKEEFCLSVIRFFIDNPMLDTAQIGPIVDYLWHAKYEVRRIFVARGVVQDLPPEQPNLSMTGRTVDTLLQQVDRWHRQLGKERKGGDFEWEHLKGVKDFEYMEGEEYHKNMRLWRIRELLSSKELAAEGRVMMHCVASYAHSCYKGNASIWSMTCEGYDGVENAVTIEVRDRTICQVRGKRNVVPNDKEKAIIKRWSVKNGLNIASYLLNLHGP